MQLLPCHASTPAASQRLKFSIIAFRSFLVTCVKHVRVELLLVMCARCMQVKLESLSNLAAFMIRFTGAAFFACGCRCNPSHGRLAAPLHLAVGLTVSAIRPEGVRISLPVRSHDFWNRLHQGVRDPTVQGTYNWDLTLRIRLTIP